MRSNLVVVTAFLCLAVGCGTGGDFPVAKVTGVVRCNGVPVPGGLVYFEPKQTGESAVVGKVGLGVIDDQGNFTVSTYGDGDGAVVGPHLVKVDKGSGPGCDCAMNSAKIVTELQVTEDGENNFTIELPEKTRMDTQAELAEDEEDEEDDEDD